MLKLFVCLTFLIISDAVLGYQEYRFNRDANGSFKLHQVPATWQTAFTTCNAEGAVLASPLNIEIINHLRITMMFYKVDRPIHLGVNALHSKGVYVSLEGVQLDSMPVTLASYGNGGKPDDCLILSVDGKVNTSSCTQYLPYFCFKHGVQNTKTNECGDNDYTFNAKTSSCYKVHEEEKLWSDAYKTCLGEGGNLVVLNDRQEAEAIMDLFPKDDTTINKAEFYPLTHIGLLDWNKDFTWITVTGQKIENVYNTWKPGQPEEKGDYGCVVLTRDGYLENFDCSQTEIKFVCEKPRKR